MLSLCRNDVFLPVGTGKIQTLTLKPSSFVFRYKRHSTFLFLSIVLTIAVSVSSIAIVACGKSVSGRIRFCESFRKGDIPVREDSIFTIGTVSMIVDLSTKPDSDRLAVMIFRVVDGRDTAYGKTISVKTNPSYSSFRFDDVLSFADTGRYVVRITTPDGNVIARNTLRIASQPLRVERR